MPTGRGHKEHGWHYGEMASNWLALTRMPLVFKGDGAELSHKKQCPDWAHDLGHGLVGNRTKTCRCPY